MRRLFAALLLSFAALAARAGEVQVAVAANFAAPMARIAEAFAAASGHTARVSTGSTGKFYAQIVAGAPFELLLAADDETPLRLIAERHAVAGSGFTYATGRLVLWSAMPGFVDDAGAVLASERFRHLAIANPKVAPYGQAAMQVLRARGLEASVARRLVTAETVAQAYQFAVTGNAELAFLPLAQLRVPGREATGSHWLVPAALHEPIRQDVVLLVRGAANPAAVALLAYLKSAPARAVMREFGYE